MQETVDHETIPVMTTERFFRPGECFHMQISTDFPDYVGVLHRHEYIEVVYVISGTTLHYMENRPSEVKRGDLYVVNVGTAHMFCKDEASAEPLIVYDLMFTPEFFDSALRGSRGMEALGRSELFHSLFQGRSAEKNSFAISGGLYTAFGELFNRMYQEYRTRSPGYLEIIRAYLLEVIITAIRMQDAAERSSGAGSKKQVIRRVMDCIEAQYPRSLTVQSLADQVHLNPDYLGRIFKEDTGQTISAQIQKVRVRNACRLLTSTQSTVSDIAYACGFNDLKFFYSVFRKYMQMSPSEYRKNGAAD